MQDIDILLVDDDADQLDIVSTYLQSAHLVVEAASSGDEALALLEHYRPEVVVSDVRMPGMDGHELYRRVRERGLDDVVFLFRSAMGDMPQRVLGLRAGADDYIVKSANLDELLLKLRLSLERRRKTRLLKELADSKRPIGILNGRLSEVPVAELIQIVAFLDLGEVAVTLQGDAHAPGVFYAGEGRIRHAETAGASGKKAFARLLAFEDGFFRVERKAISSPPTIDEPIDRCLLEGLERAGRRRVVEPRVKAFGTSFAIHPSAEILRRRFDEKTARLLATVAEHPVLEEILDASPEGDDEVLALLSRLLEEGILTGDARTPALLDATILDDATADVVR